MWKLRPGRDKKQSWRGHDLRVDGAEGRHGHESGDGVEKRWSDFTAERDGDGVGADHLVWIQDGNVGLGVQFHRPTFTAEIKTF